MITITLPDWLLWFLIFTMIVSAGVESLKLFIQWRVDKRCLQIIKETEALKEDAKKINAIYEKLRAEREAPKVDS